MKSVTFGKYNPTNSIIHKLDPRFKLLASILLIVAIFFQFQAWSTTLIMSGVYLIGLVVLMILAKVNFIELFKSLLGMWFLLLFLFAIYVFVPNSTPGFQDTGVAFTIGAYTVYWASFYMALYILIRLIIMIGMMMVLTTTTKPMDLTYAFEWYMTPLKVIHFPVHEIAMTMSIALRFIPTLLEETERIMKAQESRGVDFKKGGLFKRFKAIISLIIPLFVSSIERSEELSNAMEARGYNPRNKRTKYRELKFSFRDLIAFLITGVIFAGIIVFFVFDSQNAIDLLNVFRGL